MKLTDMKIHHTHQSKFIHNIVKVIQHKLWRVPLKDVGVLQKKLFINPVLDDAEGKQLNNSTVRAWLNEVKEAVYCTEEQLQEIKTEALRRKMETESASSTSKVQKLNSSLPSHAFDSALIYPRVEEVLNRLDSIIDQRRVVLGMEAIVGYRLSQTLPSTSLVEESSACGRDDEKETHVKLLLSDDDRGNKITVISIVGMGGIGKITFAQLLYKDVRVELLTSKHGLVFLKTLMLFGSHNKLVSPLLQMLATLSLSDCCALQCLPDSGLPSSLSRLIIDGCSLLEKRCQRGTGEDLLKIAHIPAIEITAELEKQLDPDEDEDEDVGMSMRMKTRRTGTTTSMSM